MQLCLLLWKSWKTFHRSWGWLIAQSVACLIAWALSGYLLSKLIEPSDTDLMIERMKEKEYRSSYGDHDYDNWDPHRHNNHRHDDWGERQEYGPRGYGTDGHWNDYRGRMTRNSPTAPESNEITFDEEKEVSECPLNTPLSYASSQYDDKELPMRCGEKEFHKIAEDKGKIKKLEIKDTLKFKNKMKLFDDDNYFVWMSIAPYLFPIFLFSIQASMEVTQESNSLIKDYLLSMGMNRLLYFLHHFIFHFLKAWIHVIVTSVMIGMILNMGMLTGYFVLLFSLALAAWISWALLIGSIFKKPAVTVIMSLVVWVIMLVLDIGFVNVKRTSSLSILASLSPLHAILLALDGQRESELRGMSLWFSEVKYVIPHGFYLLMLVFDTVSVFFIAVGIDWMRSSFENPLSLLRRGKMREVEDSKRLLDGNLEKSDPRGEVADIVIEGVHKIYSSGEHAVRGVNMSMRKGQVTALLGHNGAGKSTTFSMISGMTVPTRGRILVMGNESNGDKQKLIGYCPQYNPIFPKLTVDEHLKFFAHLKGVKDWQGTAYRVLTCLGMAQVGHTRAITLSGGMKRKLCMAIAMAADPPIVLLDEPTAGLDPGARRDFERLLMEWKKEHTILLTTHYTDEAELLADRIFIMARGKVFCSGSSQFLRKKFDSGYILSFAVGNESETEKASTEMITLVKEFVPDVSIVKVRGKQFELKLSTDDSKRFVEMFRKIEEVGPSLGMQSYGLSLTKLEQVFLKVGEMTGTVDRKAEVQTALKELIEENGNRTSGIVKFMVQFLYLLLKRLLFELTHLPSMILNLLFIFFIAYGLMYLAVYFSYGRKSSYDPIDVLHLEERYRIGIDASLAGNESTIQSIASHYGNLDIVSFSGSIDEWYAKEVESRPPILGVLSRRGKYWTIYIHKRDKTFVPTLEAIAARVNNPNLKKLEFRAKQIDKRAKDKEEKEKRNERRMDDEYEIAKSRRAFDTDELIYMILLSVVIIFASPFMVIRPLAFLIIERISNFGHQERLTGVNRATFLSASALFDLLFFQLPLVTMVGGCLVGAYEKSIDHLNVLIIMSLVAFGSGELIILLMYRRFASRAKGEISIIMILIGSSLGTLLFTAVLAFVTATKHASEPGTTHLYFPIYVVSPLITIMMYGVEKEKESSPGKITGPLFLALHFIGLIAILLVVELRKLMNRRSALMEVPGDNIVLRVNNLQKVYKNGKIAVNNISFGVRAHECFGVLGVNGAGKSSTFEILTGNTLPSAGSASVNGIDCGKAPTIGYCPQADALIEQLSGRHSLIILAALHGYANPRKVADIVITCVGMQEHANRASGKYSGGQRRKISVAASLLAQNSLIILDEPTAGIDPIARRDVWSVICALRENTNTAVVLTSHSMDEVEALVSNLIILREGSIVVEGSPQMIKDQYGGHYNFNLVPEAVTAVEEITAKVTAVFPGAILYDSASLKNIKYRIPRLPSDVFSTLFEKAAAIADQIKVTDFSFTQATLEDAFMLASTLQPVMLPPPFGQPQFAQQPNGFAPPPQGVALAVVPGTATTTTTGSGRAGEAAAAPADPAAAAAAATAAAPSTDPAAPAAAPEAPVAADAALEPVAAAPEAVTQTGAETGTTGAV